MNLTTNYGDTLTPRPPSESVTINSLSDVVSPTPYPGVNSSRSSRARKRWAASMHAMYMIKIFESFLHNPFYSLVLSLRMFGLVINIESRNTRLYAPQNSQLRHRISKVLRYLLSTFMLLYILYYAIRITITVTSGGFWTNLKVLIHSWITFWTVIIFLYRQKQIGSVMLQIQSLNGFASDYTVVFKRRVMTVITIAWIYLLVAIVTFFIDFSKVKSEDLFAVNFGDLQVSKTIAIIVVYVDTMLNVYFLRGTLVMIVVTYLLVCHSIEIMFKDLKDFSMAQNRQKRELTLKGLRELKNRHQLLSSLVYELDFIFSFMVFLWIVLVLISLCTRVNIIIGSEYSSANIEGWISSIWALGITLLIYIGVPLAASRLSSEFIDSVLAIEMLANTSTIKSDVIYYYELLLFLSRLSMNTILLTCYRFFEIKKQLILFIALIVIAYYFFVLHYTLVNLNIKQVLTNNQITTTSAP
ncbi:uncharacterized protein LOC128951199 [Oppia nitens]|uniref:uncharacterized protein LOC128951199 n=1 Tax=Oppia nitens TaxID=1686743 RepID=UPI0023D991EE|nr:uncharacterized protein LOC128951199 [Oppia nitens]